MRNFTTKDFAKWGAEGGKKSRRTLTTEQAKAMAKAKREKRKNK